MNNKQIVLGEGNLGQNKGSLGYGIRKNGKNEGGGEDTAIETIQKLTKSNFVTKIIYVIFKEIYRFSYAIIINPVHFRNVIYFIFSVLGTINNRFFNALLLIDIVNKIETLR
jgi:hypothetical protein